MEGESKEKEPEITFDQSCPLEEVAAFSLENRANRDDPNSKVTIEDSKERIKGFLGRPNATEIILRRDGELIGCAFSSEENEEDLRKKVPYANFFTNPQDRVFQIKGVVIKSEYRGQGFGKIIMEKIMGQTREAGATKLILTTFPEKDNPAHRLYEGLGFKETAPNQDSRSFYMQYEYPQKEEK